MYNRNLFLLQTVCNIYGDVQILSGFCSKFIVYFIWTFMQLISSKHVSILLVFVCIWASTLLDYNFITVAQRPITDCTFVHSSCARIKLSLSSVYCFCVWIYCRDAVIYTCLFIVEMPLIKVRQALLFSEYTMVSMHIPTLVCSETQQWMGDYIATGIT